MDKKFVCLYCDKVIDKEDLFLDNEIPTLGLLPYHKNCHEELKERIENK